MHHESSQGSKQHRQRQAGGHSNCWWFKVKFDSWSWGWFLCICSSTSRRDWRGSFFVSYGGSGSGSPIGTGSCRSSCVYHLGNLETSFDDTVVKWLYGTEISDTCRGVGLSELTQKVHLSKRNPKLRKTPIYRDNRYSYSMANRFITCQQVSSVPDIAICWQRPWTPSTWHSLCMRE